jgi:hypothetical protein
MGESDKSEVVLDKGPKEDYYIFYRRNGLDIARIYEIRPFREKLSETKKNIENHYLIESYCLYGDQGSSCTELIGIAYGKKELPKKLYECAVKEAKKVAKKVEGKFLDLTGNNKKQNPDKNILSKKSKRLEDIEDTRENALGPSRGDYGPAITGSGCD